MQKKAEVCRLRLLCLLIYVKIGNKAFFSCSPLLNEAIFDAEFFCVIDKASVFLTSDGTVKRLGHILHRGLLVHKAYIDFITVAVKKML